MNFYSCKTKIISIVTFSFTLMAQVQGSINTCSNVPNNCGRFVFDAELLILRPYVKSSGHCAFEEASNIVDEDGNVFSTIENGNTHNHFKWQPGFRIGAGYVLNECNWKYGISWMHFNSKTSNGNDFTRKWNFNFDTFDAIAAYTFCGNECFSITSFGGIRGAKIDQKLHLTTDLNNPIRNSDKEKFWGVGPIIGFETDTNMGCNLSLYTNIAVSWLYGTYNIHLNDVTLFDEGSSTFIEKQHIHTTQLVCDAGLGIQWNQMICNRNMFFRLGLEHHHYFDYNNFENSDLSLSGVRIAAGFEY